MEKSKLISMTAFVLQIESEVGKEDYQVVAWQTKIHGYDRINKYANFLKQPLTLGMFVPCDDDGNVLKEPCSIGVGNDFYLEREKSQFGEAQSKVMFSDFILIEILQNEYTHISNGNLSLFFHNSNEIESDTNNYNGWVSIVENFINSNYHLDLEVSF